jgi:hypothetical protein
VLGLSSPRDHGQNFEQADEAKRAFEVSEKTARSTIALKRQCTSCGNIRPWPTRWWSPVEAR